MVKAVKKAVAVLDAARTAVSMRESYSGIASFDSRYPPLQAGAGDEVVLKCNAAIPNPKYCEYM